MTLTALGLPEPGKTQANPVSMIYCSEMGSVAPVNVASCNFNQFQEILFSKSSKYK
jgi:hypothetical protein